MKDLMKAMCILAVFLGGMFATLVLLRKYTARTYLTVEED